MRQGLGGAMFKVRLHCGVSALALMTGAAAAADLTVVEPPPAIPLVAPFDWSGLYLGLGAGGGISNDEAEYATTITAEDQYALSIDGLSGESGLAEATIGFDWQAGSRFVLGALADVYWFGAEAETFFEEPSSGFVFKCPGDPCEAVERTELSIEREWGYDVLVRAGVLVNDRTLLYALGGYSGQSIEADYVHGLVGRVIETREVFATEPEATGAEEEHVQGWTVGAGVEAMVTRNASVKAEYRYTRFDDFEVSVVEELDGKMVPVGVLDVDPSQQTFRLGVNYKLDGLSAGMIAADDLAAAPETTEYGWTGIYLGVAGGYGLTHDELDYEGFVDKTDEEYAFGVDGLGGRGWLAEGAAGVDWQVGGRFVVGALADVSWFDADAQATFEESGPTLCPACESVEQVNVGVERNWGFDALVRAGVLINDRALLYALGGYSAQDIDVDYELVTFLRDTDTGEIGESETLASGSHDDHVDGWTVGLGIEGRATPNLSVKAEYRYTRLEDIEFKVEDKVGGMTGTFEAEPSQQTFRVGVNYKLNGLARN